MMSELTRRSFGRQTLGSLLTYSLLETLFSGDAVAAPIKPITSKWLEEINTLTMDLRGKELKQTEWQKKVEALFAKVDLPEMLRYIDYEKLIAKINYPKSGTRSLRANFPQVEGLPTRLVFGHQIFAMKKDRSVVPHGHNNMATAFLVLGGKFHGRHYDRLEDQAKHMIVRPTIDRSFARGDYSSISDFKDNVHWFKATSETGFIFNIHVLNVNPGSGKTTGRIYIDPNGEKLSGGRIRARRIKAGEAKKLYG